MNKIVVDMQNFLFGDSVAAAFSPKSRKTALLFISRAVVNECI